MAASKSLQLVNKSLDSMISAIELYNKPDFRYREEIFCVTAINSWELLLKAKILKDNGNDIRSISVREHLINKDGSKSKKWRYKDNRSGNKMTIDIFAALKRLKSKGIIDQICFENIEALIELRDNSVHFYSADHLLSQKVQELGTASIKSYTTLIQEWFSVSLEKYNFYLMPMSFFHIKSFDPILIGNRDVAITNLLAYVAEKEKKFPPDPSNPHNITIAIETRFTKSSTIDAKKIRVSSDPSAPEFQISLEDVRRTHPLDYKELSTKLRLRYTNFKENPKYHEIRKLLEDNQKYCFHYPLNPMAQNSPTKQIYAPAIFEEFDKHYTRIAL
ncbi:MAG: DUF3644 domain-containing protein [Candidatus Saccharimonadales bacterium]